MSRDPGSRLPDPPAVDFALPKVVNIEIRATTFKAPRHRNFKSALKNSNDAVEFIVTTDGPIPTRAVGPALYVGETAVTEASEIGPNTYRFVAMTRKGLKRTAPMVLSWTGEAPKPVKNPAFRYRLRPRAGPNATP
jgi:hypothetical protein